jgi:hypothetical protein
MSLRNTLAYLRMRLLGPLLAVAVLTPTPGQPSQPARGFASYCSKPWREKAR